MTDVRTVGERVGAPALAKVFFLTWGIRSRILVSAEERSYTDTVKKSEKWAGDESEKKL